LAALFPLLVVTAGGLLVLLVSVFIKRAMRPAVGYLALLSLAAAGVAEVFLWGRNAFFFDGALRLHPTAVVLGLLLVSAGILVVLMSLRFVTAQGLEHGEYYGLLLFGIAGLMIMVSSFDLLVVFLGLEVFSISAYGLAGLRKRDPKSGEAALKYFLTGSFASAFVVFGLAFIYGETGSLDLARIAAVSSAAGLPTLGLVGAGLALIGFAYKVALVPFHMWAPDVYEGVPTPVAALFAVAPKVAGFAVLFLFIAVVRPEGRPQGFLEMALGAIIVLTILLGNLAALRQTNLKRLLAYSSIAHSGYLALGVLAGDGAGVLFYLTAYILMNAGAFGVIAAVSRRDETAAELESFAGVGLRYPWLGAFFSVFLLSLAGFPPTAGFLGKFYVFSAAAERGYTGLVLVALLGTLISVYYYLRIIVVMYMRAPAAESAVDEDNPPLYLALFLCFILVLQVGILPGNLLFFVRRAADWFLSF
jgi:NADH-quinone oxidoreductase subunit N